MSGLLILVPTEFERQKLVPLLAECSSLAGCSVEICGFGPILAGIQTTRLLNHFQPAKVLLLGIAGTYGKALEVGTAEEFSEVACYGVGAGSGSEFQTAEQLGWSRWLQLETRSGEQLTFRDRESLGTQSGSLLVTCCAASSSVADVQDRLRLFPEAEAEDMEAYAVAASCRLANIPLRVVRGISNVAGDREKSRWQVDAALKAVAELVKAGEFV
ncbi:MAG: futalosine hydrolase [Planctomycetaceae bacterium]|nr:futalosine hydrolase [Planctomycetaceae bacterium]